MSSTGVFIIIISFVILIGLTLLIREIVCWYWKINANNLLLTEIKEQLRILNQNTERNIKLLEKIESKTEE